MAASQPDLFAPKPSARPADAPNDDYLRLIRARLHASLARVQAAERMPWDDHLEIIRHDNEFRFGKDVLPPEEGAALWAAFDVEMDRLYAEMNARLEAEYDAREAAGA